MDKKKAYETLCENILNGDVETITSSIQSLERLKIDYPLANRQINYMIALGFFNLGDSKNLYETMTHSDDKRIKNLIKSMDGINYKQQEEFVSTLQISAICLLAISVSGILYNRFS